MKKTARMSFLNELNSSKFEVILRVWQSKMAKCESSAKSILSDDLRFCTLDHGESFNLTYFVNFSGKYMILKIFHTVTTFYPGIKNTLLSGLFTYLLTYLGIQGNKSKYAEHQQP